MFDKESQETPDNSSSASLETLLAEIKNEQGEPKYADVNKAIEALKHSQDYIPQLKTENEKLKTDLEEVKEKLAKAAAMEEVLKKFTESPQDTATQEEPESPPQASGLDEQTLSATLEKLLDQRTAEQSKAANQSQVKDALSKKFGDKALEAFKAKAEEVGLSQDALEQLSAESPTAVLALFNVQNASSPAPTAGTYTPPRGTPPSEALAPPEKSLLTGAKSKDQIDYLLKIREAVYKKHNIQV